jgi:tetratricopeptide (TPR) repeat protein
LAVHSLGTSAYGQGDLARARAHIEEGLALLREAGDQQGVANAMNNLGMVALVQGGLERAATLFAEALALSREAGYRWNIALSLHNLEQLARRRGEVAQAEALGREALALYWERGHPQQCANALFSLGSTAAAAGQGERAARLLGAAAALRETLGDSLLPPDRELDEQPVAAVRAALGEERWAAAFAAGQATSIAWSASLTGSSRGSRLRVVPSGAAG